MTPEERAERARQKLIANSRMLSVDKYARRNVAPIFQRMVRAEYGASSEQFFLAVVQCQVVEIPRYIGECVCITCGKVHAWNSGLKGMHTGHFVPSRRLSILFDERNVAPQCSRCNRYEDGNPVAYRLWMETVHGLEVIDELRRLKHQTVTFSREELVDMKIEYSRRLRVAAKIIKQGASNE